MSEAGGHIRQKKSACAFLAIHREPALALETGRVQTFLRGCFSTCRPGLFCPSQDRIWSISDLSFSRQVPVVELLIVAPTATKTVEIFIEKTGIGKPADWTFVPEQYDSRVIGDSTVNLSEVLDRGVRGLWASTRLTAGSSSLRANGAYLELVFQLSARHRGTVRYARERGWSVEPPS